MMFLLILGLWLAPPLGFLVAVWCKKKASYSRKISLSSLLVLTVGFSPYFFQYEYRYTIIISLLSCCALFTYCFLLGLFFFKIRKKTVGMILFILGVIPVLGAYLFSLIVLPLLLVGALIGNCVYEQEVSKDYYYQKIKYERCYYMDNFGCIKVRLVKRNPHLPFIQKSLWDYDPHISPMELDEFIYDEEVLRRVEESLKREGLTFKPFTDPPIS
jgi:hypothetical protein